MAKDIKYNADARDGLIAASQLLLSNAVIYPCKYHYTIAL